MDARRALMVAGAAVILVLGACGTGPPVVATFPPTVTPVQASASTAVVTATATLQSATATPAPVATPTPSATHTTTVTSTPTVTPTPTSTPAPTPTQAPTQAPSSPTSQPPSPTPDGGTTTHVKIVSSLPLRGGQAINTRAVVNAIGMALDDAGNRAGGVAIDWVSLDDSNPVTGRRDPDIEAANATQAAADPAVIAYVGPFNSDVAKSSIPILCQAGIAMISPSNTVPSLTKPGFGLLDEPARYYPNCARNYARVISTDELIGTAAAVLGGRLGAHKAYVLAVPGTYGQLSVPMFLTRAAQLGIVSVGREDIPSPDVTAAGAIAARIAAAGADLVYDSGDGSSTPMHAWILQALRAAGSSAAFLGGPNFPSPGFLLPAAGAAAEGAYAIDYLRPDSYSGPAATWARRYQARFAALGLDDRFAINAFEATNVILAAMNGAAGSVDRATVRANVMATRTFDGALGRWSFDANGDTTLASYSVVRVVGGIWTTTGVASAAP